MIKRAIVSLLCLVSVLGAYTVAKAQSPIAVTVTAYYDTNSNGKRDTGERVFLGAKSPVYLWLWPGVRPHHPKLLDSQRTDRNGTAVISVPTNVEGAFSVVLDAGAYCGQIELGHGEIAAKVPIPLHKCKG